MREEAVRYNDCVMLISDWSYGDIEDGGMEIGQIYTVEVYGDEMYDDDQFGFKCYETGDWTHNPQSFRLVFPHKFDQANFELKKSRDSGQGELYESTEI